jgi:hypothetical protein
MILMEPKSAKFSVPQTIHQEQDVGVVQKMVVLVAVAAAEK